MKIKVSEIPEDGLDIDEQALLKVNDSQAPAHMKLHVQKSGAEVLIEGGLEAELELTCSRCLKQFRKKTSMPVDLVYRPVEELEDESYELEPDELDTGFYREDEIDLDAVVSEQLILSIPIKVLCDEGCKGICPSCGKDLNLEGCDCTVGHGASKMEEELKKFLKKERS